MKRGSTLFLRSALIAIGAVVLALCTFALPALWRAAAQEYPGMTYPIYGIVVAMYITAIPFFIGLYRALYILRLIDMNQAFSTKSVSALKQITYCASVISAAYVASLPFFYLWGDRDDAPGLVVIGMVLVMAPLAVSVAAAVLRRLLQEAIAIKSENELTV